MADAIWKQLNIERTEGFAKAKPSLFVLWTDYEHFVSFSPLFDFSASFQRLCLNFAVLSLSGTEDIVLLCMAGISKRNEVKRMNRRFMTGALAVLTGVSSVAMVCPMTALASSSFAMRKKTVKSANIIDSVDVNKESSYVTRKEFAKMLVMASSYRSAVSAYNDVAVFSDVAKDDAYASYIRVATEQGWMTAFLGGKFKPDETVSFGEAVKGCLALLGYTNDSFSGNQLANRVTKAQAIGLSEDIAKTSLTDAMSYQDCINLFYNLLKTNTAANEN